jgi:LPXTG-motif cell wall-anchored protein
VKFDKGGEKFDALWDLNLHAGDTLTMSWSGAAHGCADADSGQPIAPVTLAVYGGVTSNQFQMGDHQYLLASASCGASTTGATPCAQDGNTYSLSLLIPGEDQCYAQIDGVLGAPLAKVGPDSDESYYSASTRGDEGPDLLIRASVETTPAEGSEQAPTSNLITASVIIGSEYCAPTTTTTEAPTTTTTEAPPTTTTEAPTTTTAPPVVSPTVSPTVAPTEVAEVQPAVAVAGVTVARQLPVTGAHTGVLVLLGTSLILLGGIALLFVRHQAQGVTTS